MIKPPGKPGPSIFLPKQPCILAIIGVDKECCSKFQTHAWCASSPGAPNQGYHHFPTHPRRWWGEWPPRPDVQAEPGGCVGGGWGAQADALCHFKRKDSNLHCFNMPIPFYHNSTVHLSSASAHSPRLPARPQAHRPKDDSQQASKSARVAPIRTATAKPCIISS